jgi:adenosylcobinamide-phosphate synthase
MPAALVCGWVLDRWLGDPPRWHPVAGFGRAAAALERALWRPSRAAGALHTAILVGAPSLAVAMLDHALRRRRLGRPGFRAAVVWLTLGGRSLERTALRMAVHLELDDLDAARALVPALVGRDPSRLDAGGLCRATVESVAENTGDAIVAPLLWAALLGAPGAAGYRAANTLDAMYGHRSERNLRFGWAAAKLDDLLNWPAARVAALLAIMWAPAVGGRPDQGWRAAFTDGSAHPSPNAGRVEGAFAGALSRRLGGITHYRERTERRPLLGTGPPPGIDDIAPAVKLCRLVGASSTGLCAVLAWRVAR